MQQRYGKYPFPICFPRICHDFIAKVHNSLSSATANKENNNIVTSTFRRRVHLLIICPAKVSQSIGKILYYIGFEMQITSLRCMKPCTLFLRRSFADKLDKNESGRLKKNWCCQSLESRFYIIWAISHGLIDGDSNTATKWSKSRQLLKSSLTSFKKLHLLIDVFWLFFISVYSISNRP